MTDIEDNPALETTALKSTCDNTTPVAKVPNHQNASWFRQFRWCLWKNSILIMRYPRMLVFVWLSSIIAVLLSWVVGGKGESYDVIHPPPDAYTDCGLVSHEYLEDMESSLQDKVQSTFNEEWRDGVEVAMMGLGGLATAIFVFSVVSSEVHDQLLGMLRATGLPDSVYWLSWYMAFANLSLINALLGALTAKVLPGHVYESVFFGGIFASLFFLNMALVSGSLFLVAVCGTSCRVSAIFCILFMIVAAFIPFFAQAIATYMPMLYEDNYLYPYPNGLFWETRTTATASYSYDFDNASNDTSTSNDVFCSNFFIMNEHQGKEVVTIDDFFVGW